MDPSINILWLAQKMIELLSSDRSIDIEFIGIRPGEKLYEQLWNEKEKPLTTSHQDILGLSSLANFSRAELSDRLSEFEKLARTYDASALRSAL